MIKFFTIAFVLVLLASITRVEVEAAANGENPLVISRLLGGRAEDPSTSIVSVTDVENHKYYLVASSSADSTMIDLLLRAYQTISPDLKAAMIIPT
ncbi:hypothetical protein RND71_003271 [Anisodus tanguticus]|uniref:Uncharacterized protein n=1 Tax=Anisodus tanguticus TaxID=243964 RepID=A0AAE1VX03_9SOLA|nr:hypothetical protein RND71_003271 [Anisodus tanguticus]